MTNAYYNSKPATFLRADVTEYNRRIGDDEVATVSTPKSNHYLIAEKILPYKGRAIDSQGDNILAELRSTADAVALP